ncbi:ABC transporter ATP-binding protein [Acidaminobacter hydrogenoformans]|uniref:Branched-chain amino acid transport system ATP-binding protein n=1 Tax=Acidaminobacter hydrogenoformans DSM 2784 TaxID=1120920 RepID=A0A1G5S2S5_9FIRM|nr:ABC transporter ATP-binding protein [Acidaminobacter hydrogenoformans]SCZ79869.1 branched-chain amino acid transport system ATP-binding protein [Acidaminobacter hydrogenoformans DSM 2784]
MPILEVKNLKKSFGGNQVFSDINISVNENQIYGIIGTNGAGKTTLFNIICGVFGPDSGQVIYKGQNILGKKPWELARMGIGRCFQTVMPFKSMTPYENARVARANAGKHSPGKELFTLDEIMELTDLKDKQNIPTQDLSLPDKKNVEIARALACNPDIVLFDEVSCGLSGEEIQARMALMKKLAAAGITVIVIEHIMVFIKEICDRVAVLHSGIVIAEGTPHDVSQNKHVIEAYLGGKEQ